LRAEYEDAQKSAADIARENGCSENAILSWLKKHDIPRRTVSQARAIKHWAVCGEQNGMYGRTGNKNPRWKGGVSPERQCVYASSEWARAVVAVWDRDKGICSECGTENTNRRRMYIHHNLGFNEHPEARLDIDNLRLMCARCHSLLHWRIRKAQKGGGSPSAEG
jgi:5-methylcytosine-specific restriction endonuclease McrA